MNPGIRLTIKSVCKSFHEITLISPQSLGKAQTAAVKRDAEIGVAQVPFYSMFRNVFQCSSMFSNFGIGFTQVS